MMLSVITPRQTFQIIEAVVPLVIIFMMNVVTRGDRPVSVNPLRAMKMDRPFWFNTFICSLVIAALIAVPELSTPLDTLIAHAASPR